MARPKISDKVRLKLWTKSAGRCQFRGCNEPLYRDDKTYAQMNRAYIAHIVAHSPDGPRGDEKLSPQLDKEFSNLMLLCDAHHRLIDDPSNEDTYSVELLKTYKKEHEDRIEYLTSIDVSYKSHLLFFKDNIGTRKPEIEFEDARWAILPRFPASSNFIEIDLTHGAYRDHEENYFRDKQREISRLVETKVRQRSDINYLSVFAFASIPLLIHFGYELGDTISANIYQRHRSTNSWKWQDEDMSEFQYVIEENLLEDEAETGIVALNLSLSGTIRDEEIYSALEKPHNYYKLTIANPNPNFLKSEEQLDLFKAEIRSLLRRIRETHGHDCEIHLFPAIPLSVAVSIGCILLPKIDPKIHVYENNDGFSYALTIAQQYKQV
ncbi:MAG: SAVED domain-containing protein [Cyanobacteria bacterium J06598_4]